MSDWQEHRRRRDRARRDEVMRLFEHLLGDGIEHVLATSTG
jgi:hypothetical protein